MFCRSDTLVLMNASAFENDFRISERGSHFVLMRTRMSALHMKLRILYHGNCFDGVSSAAIFTRFYRAKIDPAADVFYTPTMHRAGNAFDRDQLDGDENAIVDFKYCADDRLTWWFDHHQSAFLSS